MISESVHSRWFGKKKRASVLLLFKKIAPYTDVTITSCSVVWRPGAISVRAVGLGP